MAVSKNEHTGDFIASRINTKDFDNNYDNIFRKRENLECPGEESKGHPMVLSEVSTRESLVSTEAVLH